MHASSSTLLEPPPAPLSLPVAMENEPTTAQRIVSFQRMQMMGIRLVVKATKAVFFTALFIVLSWVVLSIQSLLLNL